MLKMLSLIVGSLAVVVLLSPSAPSQSVVQPGTIKGVVLGVNGLPVFGVEVRLTSVIKKHHKATGTSAEVVAGSRGGQKTSTMRDGTFTFTGVQPGEHRVIAGNKAIGRGHAKVDVASGATATVQIHLEPVKK